MLYPFFQRKCLCQGRTLHCTRQCFKNPGEKSPDGWVSDDSPLARELRRGAKTNGVKDLASNVNVFRRDVRKALGLCTKTGCDGELFSTLSNGEGLCEYHHNRFVNQLKREGG